MMLDVGGNEHFRLFDLMKYQIFVTPEEKRDTRLENYSILCLRQSTASTSSVLAKFNPLPVLKFTFFILH